MPETDAKAAERVAERCRALLFKEQITHANSPAGQILTLSMGIGNLIPSQQDDPRAFLDAVDRSLYQAKQQGRNRIVNGN